VIELSKQSRDDSIASIKRYFEENLPEPVSDLPANLLLNFILEEIGPAIYNQAIKDAQGACSIESPISTASFTKTSSNTGPAPKPNAANKPDLCSLISVLSKNDRRHRL
jgi:uncharacterized protein (DUF2164 family)